MTSSSLVRATATNREHVHFFDLLVSHLPGIGKYTAGPRTLDIFTKMKKLAEEHTAGIGNILGEHDQNPCVIEDTVRMYKRLLFHLRTANRDVLIRPAISLKPTQFGLNPSPYRDRRDEFSVIDRMTKLVDAARDSGIFVWLDMEDHTTTNVTLELFDHLHDDAPHLIGIALQANLRRTATDLRSLAEAAAAGGPVHVRLVRGIYSEPPEISYITPTEMHAEFARLISFAFTSPLRVSVGTHHPDQLIRALAMEGMFPGHLHDFQFLLGAAETIPNYLTAKGYPCTLYVPGGPRFLDYGIRRLHENPKGFFGLITASMREKRNLARVAAYLDGALDVDTTDPNLPIHSSVKCDSSAVYDSKSL